MARDVTIERGGGGAGRGAGADRFIWQLLGALLLLLLAAAATLAFLVALRLLPPGDLVIGRWAFGEQLLAWVQATEGVDRILVAVGAVAVALGSLALLTRGLGLGRSGGGAAAPAERHLLVADEKGFVVVETDSVESVARDAALHAPGVVEARVQVQGTGGSPVRVRVQLGVHAGADVKGAGSQARDAVRQAMERTVGLEVRDVLVNVRVIEADELIRVLR